MASGNLTKIMNIVLSQTAGIVWYYSEALTSVSLDGLNQRSKGKTASKRSKFKVINTWRALLWTVQIAFCKNNRIHMLPQKHVQYKKETGKNSQVFFHY